RPGDRVFVSRDGQGELATVAVTERAVVTLESPLAQSYVQATLAPAGLPRFGTPRCWIRARLRDDDPPPRSAVNSIHFNAGLASQVQTFENERVGSSTGEPRPGVFLEQTPLPEGEVVGGRALSRP